MSRKAPRPEDLVTKAYKELRELLAEKWSGGDVEASEITARVEHLRDLQSQELSEMRKSFRRHISQPAEDVNKDFRETAELLAKYEDPPSGH